MLPQLIDEGLAKLQTIPTRDQVACVLLAARRCEPIASCWFEAQRLEAAYRDYETRLDQWLAGKASDKSWTRAAQPLDRRLNREIENEPDLPGAMAAHSLLDSEAISLGFWPEMLDEILRTAVSFAAAAFTGSHHVPVEVDTDRLGPGELTFIRDWWRECTRAFPALGS
jgi:hypothetical protein